MAAADRHADHPAAGAEGVTMGTASACRSHGVFVTLFGGRSQTTRQPPSFHDVRMEAVAVTKGLSRN